MTETSENVMRSDTRGIEDSSTSGDSGTHGVVPPRGHRRRRYVLVGLLVVAVVGALLVLSLIATARGIRADLDRGRSAMERGRGELFGGDLTAAAESLRDGRASFARAQERTDGLLFRAAGWIPILGRTTDVVDAVADSAVTAADAVIVLADAAADLPEGLASLAPTRGGIALDRLPPLSDAAGEADALMSGAVARLDEAPTSLLLGPVTPARREAEEQLTDLSRSIHAAHLILGGLPGFLGDERPQRYFFGAQSPAELRGTGGLIGAYSILTIDEGRFHFSPFVPIHDLEQPPIGSIPSPNEDYHANYDQFRVGDRFWTSINVMPDLPSVGREILTSYEAVTGERLDGVILADPFAEAALLQASGPVRLPGYGVDLGADNVVAFTTHDAYGLFTDSAKRKRVLGDVARAAFERFLGQGSVDHMDLETFVEAAADRHVQVFSADPAMQEGLRATPVGGALHPPGTGDDVSAVVVNSAAGSKVDFYQDRTLTYAIDLQNEGFAATDLDVTLRNEAPASGEPAYIIGPFRRTDAGTVLEDVQAGESVALVNAYCGADCVPVERRERDVDPKAVPFKTDLGMRYVQRYVPIRSGRQRTLSFSWLDQHAWQGNSSGGAYRFTFANQTTVKPTTLHVRIEPPDGMRIVSASAPLRLAEGAAVYDGQPDARLDLDVEFAPSLPVRLWRDVTRFLTEPVFGD